METGSSTVELSGSVSIPLTLSRHLTPLCHFPHYPRVGSGGLPRVPSPTEDLLQFVETDHSRKAFSYRKTLTTPTVVSTALSPAWWKGDTVKEVHP